VTGQIFFKHAVSDQVSAGRSHRLIDLAAGVLVMTIGFFTWLRLLRQFELSYLYPFDGLDRVLLAFGAWLFLREKMQRNLWIGVILICLVTILVSGT
jgi:drug/metabolite transporter (DMT)-like permease